MPTFKHTSGRALAALALSVGLGGAAALTGAAAPASAAPMHTNHCDATSTYVDSNNIVWIVTDIDILVSIEGGGQVYPLAVPHDRAVPIDTDHNFRIWCSTW